MSRKRKNKRQSGSAPVAVSQEELTAIVAKAQAALSAEESAKLKAAVELIGFLRTEIESKQTSIERLKRMLFGAPTEKTGTVLGKESGSALTTLGREPATKATPAPGHGRNGAAAYSGAKRVKITHPRLSSGDACPGCGSGKVYVLVEPATAVRIGGMAPLSACVYERDRLRCNLCGEVYTAPAPEEVGEQKYDETASSMVGMLKYGAGLPFNRIERLQSGMGIPLPAATQWDLVNAAATQLGPVHEELVRQAAQGQLLHNDDTTMRILRLTREQRAAALGDTADEERTGVFTSGIVAVSGGRKIVLFFTGARHAGENLDQLLKRRAVELAPPIQMCDGLSSNETKDFDTLLSNCLAHARRKYVDVAESFPEEVRFVLETLRAVYRCDAEARSRGLSPKDRLQLHQDRSGPLMQQLYEWMQVQFAERRVEPNSGLGEAIQYMQNHWDALTLFLRVAGAVLDNNICERVLKKAILHRKNSLFYRTLSGARVGDIFMSLIHTAELSRVNPFEYLVALQRHAKEAAERPAQWMPWNYQDTLTGLATGPPA
jgi:transposase